MNHKAIRNLFVHTWKIAEMRITFPAGIALILLAAGLVAMGQSSAASNSAEIRATGTFTTAFSSNICQPGQPIPSQPPPCVPSQTVGNLNILSRYAVSTFTGSLAGTSLSLHTNARDDVVEHKAFVTTVGTFWGTLDGLQGSFSFDSHFVTDRSDLTLPVLPIEGKLVVVEGTGMGGLEGTCGGGTFKSVLNSSGLPTGVAEYDFTFRFGKDCKANN